MDPFTVGLLINSAKILWGKYQDVEARNDGLSAEQLKARLDALDDVVRQNFKIIEQLNTQAQSQKIKLIGAYALSAFALLLAAYLAFQK